MLERTFTQTLEKALIAKHWDGKHHTGILTGFLKNTRAVQNTNTCFSDCGTSSTCLHDVKQLFPVRWMANQRHHSKAEELERRCLSSVPLKKGISRKTDTVLFPEGLYPLKCNPQEIKHSVKGHLGTTSKRCCSDLCQGQDVHSSPPQNCILARVWKGELYKGCTAVDESTSTGEPQACREPCVPDSAGTPLGKGCSEHQRGEFPSRNPPVSCSNSTSEREILRSSHKKKEIAKSEEEGLQGKKKKI